MAAREGTTQPSFEHLEGKGNTKVSKDHELENNSSNVETLKANVILRGGKWYFEVKVLTHGGSVRVGWCTANHTQTSNGLGSDNESWSYDQYCQQTFTGGKETNSRYGGYPNGNDVIGVIADIDGKTLSFYQNGRDLGTAFQNVNFGDGISPAVSISRKQKIQVNLGQKAFKYSLNDVFPDLHAIHMSTTKSQMDDLTKLFEKYKAIGVNLNESTENEDVIKGQGLMDYSTDLGITDDKDPGLLVIAWKLGVNHGKCWEYSRNEFVMGWAVSGAHNLKEMKNKLDEWKKELNTPARFKSFYQFCFDYLKEERKILSMEEALTVWEMIGMDKRWPLMGKWIEFLAEKKAISRDTWRLFLNFTEQFPNDVSTYDADGCWPSMIDDFVDFMQPAAKKKK
eukprot:TRINITY_DN873_c0_g1_i1.p1 TRINITY_DN873_c0_g1~~TRINITY_DN873_c0_g1_i1.p1  ORF type:complete len:396 (+),score=157.60 TRINITY_DN873_c0_g1_i1:165-1352(+)